MYIAKIENSHGQSVVLTDNESEFQVINISGLNPPAATVNTTKIAGLDGSKFNSAVLNNRNIVLMIRLNGDVESNRLLLYRMFPTKETVTFYYKNDSRNVYITGYVETVECSLFTNSETMQVSIICPNPYFLSMNETQEDISDIVPAFEFPFAINNDDPIPVSEYITNRETDIINRSEAETGAVIEIDFETDVEKIEIKNTVTGETLTLNYQFKTGDKVIIDTHKGNKKVRLIRDGVNSNIFSSLLHGSVFFQLAVGDNYFAYQADDGVNDQYVFIKFIFTNEYRGV